LLVARGRVATVAQIDHLSRELAGMLAGVPAPPDGLVGLASPGGPGFLAAFVAVRRCGLAALLMDPGTPPEGQHQIARSLGAPVILEIRSSWPADVSEASLHSVPGGAEAVHLPGIGVAKLTSGSTGAPRGIAATDQSLLADDAALRSTFGITSEDRLLAAIPLSHAYGLSSLVLPALVLGLPLVLPEALHPLASIEAAREFEATFFPTAPAFLQALVRTQEPVSWPDCLRLVISAGAPLDPVVARAFRRRFGRPVHVFYGASEVGGICYDREGSAGERGTVGTPVDGVEVMLNREAGTTSDAGGTVAIRSPAVAERYLPEGDARLEGGVFRSQDMGRWENGELRLLGRREDWINVDGRKVNPREVEAVLKGLPGVDDAAVLGVSMPDCGRTSVRAVLAGNGEKLGYLDVVSRCRERLAPHQTPRSILWVTEIPRTRRGKIDWPAIRKLGAHGLEGSS
jgi:long-chain acyl-CoA synthetase